MNDRLFNLAIFASGAGSNAKKIIEHFQNSKSVHISLIVCNKPGAGIIEIAQQFGIPVLLIEKERFFKGDAYLEEIKKYKTDLIVLAGFLWKIPSQLIQAFPDRIINIHPALLPKYGGKGMYGHFVHNAVIAAGEKESGISIHVVDELYDHGKTIFQAICAVEAEDSAESLARRVQLLEHEYFPKVIEEYLKRL